ncbi:glycosyltransferase family 8 protein [Helicobacter canis]|uniref:Glycosyl transferase family 8 C-terminal domain-containing protein n=1 Tax=Helicobacter canis NCTC 12740 TaxID=1357399 RepID=V8CHS9_9HELI|nr:glycosyltransferase family 8 protein [Helicobacter canis]ETD26938.1 hypothetical protein HMPREF2087_01332 [Helicobacter canis NCTC 12740]
MPSLESTCENSSANAQSKQRAASLENEDSSKVNSASAEYMDSKETSVIAERYPLFSKEATLCHATATALARNDDENSLCENEDSRKNAQNLNKSQAAGFCDDFVGCQAGGEGSYLSGNDQDSSADSRKSAQKPTPKPSKAQSSKSHHIFFNSSTPYLKYLSVLLHSIVAHANATNSAPFVFHILLDSRGFDESSQAELAKLPALESLLNSTHPCTISTHDCATLLDTINAPRNQTRVIYSRLFLARFVPKSVQKALYLDVDMLALSDVREIFASDMQDSIIAVVRDVVSKQSPLSAREATSAPYHFSPKHIYFNSGMMLINLPKWQEERIEQRCVEFLNTYCALYFDQDALNAVVGENAHYLDISWNLQTQFYNQYRFYEYRIANALSYKNPLAQSFAARKIIHYVCEPKPWDSPYLALDSTHLPMFGYERAIWWDLARRTKPFAKELTELESSFASTALEDYAHALSKDLQAMQLRVDKIIALLKNPLGFAYRACKARFTK